MFSENENGEPQFKVDWKAVFERDYCKICEHRKICPINWKCSDMEQFIKDRGWEYANMDDDDTNL